MPVKEKVQRTTFNCFNEENAHAIAEISPSETETLLKQGLYMGFCRVNPV